MQNFRDHYSSDTIRNIAKEGEARLASDRLSKWIIISSFLLITFVLVVIVMVL